MSVLFLVVSNYFNECNLYDISSTSFYDLTSYFSYWSLSFRFSLYEVFLPMKMLSSRFALFRASKSMISYSWKLCNLKLPVGVEPSPLNKVSFRDTQNSLKSKMSSFITFKMDSSFFLLPGMLKIPNVSKKNPGRVCAPFLGVLASMLWSSGVLGLVSCSLGLSNYVDFPPLLWYYEPSTLYFSSLGSYYSLLSSSISSSSSLKIMGALLGMVFLPLLVSLLDLLNLLRGSSLMVFHFIFLEYFEGIDGSKLIDSILMCMEPKGCRVFEGSSWSCIFEDYPFSLLTLFFPCTFIPSFKTFFHVAPG